MSYNPGLLEALDIAINILRRSRGWKQNGAADRLQRERDMRHRINQDAGKRRRKEQFVAEVDGFIARVHGTIQDARMKMSDEEVTRADKNADGILNAASGPERPAPQKEEP